MASAPASVDSAGSAAAFAGREFDVVVIGAGLAGLIVARNSLRRGLSVLVFEARNRVGGRCWTREFPAAGHSVEMGGEWVDMDVHDGMKDECAQYGIPLVRPDVEKSAWNFHFPGRKVISRCQMPSSEQRDYERVVQLLNEDLSRILFKSGYDLEDVEYIDVSFREYVEKRLMCKSTSFMHDYLLAEAFRLSGGTDCETVSALSVLHDLCGFGSLEERFNTKPRRGDPFKKKDLARLGGGGTSALCEAMAEEIKSRGGTIRLSSPVGAIFCEDTAKEPPPRWCAMCAVYTYPFCSLHGPRVVVADGLGVMYRARACVVAVPLNCLPCIKFVPPLPDALAHAAEVGNVGDCSKTWALATDVAWDVDEVLSWPSCPLSYVSHRGLPADVLGSSSGPEADQDLATAWPGTTTAGAGQEGGEESPGAETGAGPVHVVCMLALKETLPPATASQAEYKAAAEAMLRKNHHPSLRLQRVLAYDWKTDRWAKGSAMALRAGGGRLVATACTTARQPWAHTRNLFVAGSDLVVGWAGWMEGAVQSGQEAFAAIERFMFPVLPEGRWMKKIHAKDDNRLGAK